MRKTVLILLALAAVGGITAILLLGGPLGDITQAPSEDDGKPAPQTAALSHIALPVTIPFAELARYANEKIPQVLVNKREHKRYKKRALGISMTFKGRLTSHLRRNGSVVVGRHKDRLEFKVPLKFNLRFKGSDALDPDIVSKGEVMLRLRFELGMTPQWQPTVKVYPSYRWRGNPKLKIGILRLDARDILGDALQERLDKLGRELEQDVRESAGLQTQAADRWHELHQVRQLGDGDTPAWLIVDPQAAYFAPVKVTDDALQLQFALAAKLTTLVGKVLPPPEAEPLPDLIIAPPPNDGFRLQLPVSLDYAGLTKELRGRYVDKTLDIDPGQITFKDFRLYSSGEQLVVGAKIHARAPGRLLNSHGWLYLQGRPVYDNDSHLLQISEFNFTPLVDNWLVRSASWILHDRLRAEIAAGLHYDLSERVAATRSSINKRLNRAVGDGFTMSGQLDTLSLDRIQPRADDLLLLLDARGTLAIGTELAAPGANEPLQSP